MQRFAQLYLALDASTGTTAKVRALAAYFRTAPPHDAAWATYFLAGRKLKRLASSRDLRAAALLASGLPEWLFEASYEAVGDLAETIALVVPAEGRNDTRTLAQWVDEELAPLGGLPPDEVRARLIAAWNLLDHDSRFVYIKLLTGAFRVGAAKQLVYRALAEATGVAVTDVAARLAGEWRPDAAFLDRIGGHTDADAAAGHRPYPFFLAHPLEREPESLGPLADWQAEWKWDGIRAQLLVRASGATLWSRGDELVSDAFPEIIAAAARLPKGIALDGEILAWEPDAPLPLPFASLQRRLNRKAPGARLLRETPVALVAYDLLEWNGNDVRNLALDARRELLAGFGLPLPELRLSPVMAAADWTALAALRATSRARRTEGMMLKRRSSAYGVGRTRGDWWKWKVDPYTVDAVLVYAQAGHGRRASLFTDYTFAIWHEGELLPFAKAYSGLDDNEIRAVDAWVRSHTLERFGPVRRCCPNSCSSSRSKDCSRRRGTRVGIAVRFPRILRWRRDKPAAEADTLAALRTLMDGAAGAETA